MQPYLLLRPSRLLLWVCCALAMTCLWIGKSAFSSEEATPPLLQNIKQVVAGDSHTCVLTQSGAVRCWGDNGREQLNTVALVDTATPITMTGLVSGVAALAAGGWHTCALLESGRVTCWGYNVYGQLGNTSTISNQAKSLAAGDAHTCVLTKTGGATCWGSNGYGQLGDGTRNDSVVPVDVKGLNQGVLAIALGRSHSCALIDTGAVRCWGWNYHGQLGDGTQNDQLLPVTVSGLITPVTSLTANGDHTCAVTNDGAAFCWGKNDYGQLGDGSQVDRSTSTAVSGLSTGVVALFAGDQHTCAQLAPQPNRSTAACWGRNNVGQLGDGTTVDHLTPTDVLGFQLTNNRQLHTLAAGANHTCALFSDAQRTHGLQCWGENSHGQLGDGQGGVKRNAVDVLTLSNEATAISAGAQHSCLVSRTGGVQCWGNNTHGEIGDGSTQNRLLPVDVSGLNTGTVAIAVGSLHSCALLTVLSPTLTLSTTDALSTTHRVRCWGNNNFGQLGDGSTENRTLPVTVTGLISDVTAVTAGDAHSCALLADGRVQCWGRNRFGQLGDGTTATRLTPVEVQGLTGPVIDIAAGGLHTCALQSNGEMHCWGNNSFGQLGDGTTAHQLTAQLVNGFASNVVAIATGWQHSCALTQQGATFCWGWNYFGQLGTGSTANASTPVQVSRLISGVLAVSAGQGHTCARLRYGEIYGEVRCWGNNTLGQLGDGSTTNRLTPVTVQHLGSDVIDLDAGGQHNCVVTGDGHAKCWGDNTSGQSGDRTAWRTIPADVIAVAPSPTATPTFAPTPTVTYTPSITPTPTQTPKATDTPIPTSTPEPEQQEVFLPLGIR